MARRAAAGLYKMRTITRLTGLSPAVLRAWEARFDFLAPERAPGGHRLYTEDDLRILEHVQGALAGGRSIGEVALAGRAALLARARSAPPAAEEKLDARPARASLAPDLAAPLAQLRDRIVRGAVELDEQGAREAIDAAFAAVSPEVALEQVLAPAARTIGALWAAGDCGVAGEHLVSGLFAERLRGLLEAGRSRATGPLVLVACLPDELHELGTLVVAYGLARHGLRVALLGASLPIEDLEAACDRLRPAAVCISVARESVLATHLPALAGVVKRKRDRCAFFVGGEGARGDLPALEAAGAERWAPGRPLDELALAVARPGPARPGPARIKKEKRS